MKLLLILFAITSTLVFDSCLKKGEDDPCISLRSRKARIVGDWKVVSYKYAKTDDWITHIYSNDYTMDGSTYTSIYTDNINGTTTANGIETWEWTFSKDGTYNYSCTIDGQIKTCGGNWYLFGNEGSKDESQINCNVDCDLGPFPFIYTGYFVDFPYHLKELRNKKMVWTSEASSISPGYNVSTEIEIIFEAK